MNYGIVPLSQTRARLDAAFNLLAQRHKEAYEDIAKNYTIDELKAFALDLPFDSQAFNAVFPSTHPRYASDLAEMLETKTKCLDPWCERSLDVGAMECPYCHGAKVEAVPSKVNATNLAVYCAAAASNALAKYLLQVLELRKEELAILNHSSAMLKGAKDKGCLALLKAMKGKTTENL